MANNITLKKRWRSNGKKYGGKVNGRVIPKDVTVDQPSGANGLYVHEIPRSVDMDENIDKTGKEKEPYGVPIDSTLAVALIAEWLVRIKDTEQKLDDALNKKATLLFTDQEMLDLKELLNRSLAITMDKNIILKTLSQPGCEGIRFYMCLKSIPKTKEIPATDYLSLVTVGVDAEGQDHYYRYDEKAKQKGIAAVPSTTSVLSEYASPPPPRKFRNEEYDKRFAIMKYAEDESVLLTNSTAKKRKQKK